MKDGVQVRVMSSKYGNTEFSETMKKDLIKEVDLVAH